MPSALSWVSATQLGVFRRYAGEHGKLIVAGDDFAAFDDKCRGRSPDVARIEQAIHLPPSPAKAKLMAALGSLAGVIVDPTPGLGVNAYAKPAHGRPTEIVLHLVNYNVSLGRESKEPPTPVEDVIVRVPLPSRWRVTSLEAFSPCDDEGLAARFEQGGATAVVRIPKLHLYQVIRIAGKEGD